MVIQEKSLPDHCMLERILHDTVLIEAWGKVRANDGGPGTDGVTVAHFAEGLLAHLEKLRTQVWQGNYTPQPLLRVAIAKPDGGERLLAIPAVRDRVLQTAAALVLGPLLEPGFEDDSFAYRPGRSVRMAVERVIDLRDEGLPWVVDADIRNYFDTIPHSAMLQVLSRHVQDDKLLGLVQLWLKTPIQERDGSHIHPQCGIPQGSPLSPLLANLFLTDMDAAFAQAGYAMVRYADDFVVLCRDELEARRALRLVEREIERHGLCLHPEKTRVTDFAGGFDFLGVHFEGDRVRAVHAGSEPWLLPESIYGHKAEPEGGDSMAESDDAADEGGGRGFDFDQPPAPLLRTLYLTRQGLHLGREGERLEIRDEETTLFSLPARKLDQVMVHGQASISTGALALCAEAGVRVLFADKVGKPWGEVEVWAGQRFELARLQHRRQEAPEFGLEVARRCACAKIANARVLLRRYLRRHAIADGEFRQLEMAELAKRAAAAPTLDTLRGYEGNAARIYFGALSDMLPANWAFGGRNRQPPRDPVNAMLSYGYAVLYGNVLTLLRRHGLDPALGHLHASGAGQAALACDLMEPFRALVVDAAVLQAIFLHRIRTEDFSLDPDDPEQPCHMQEATRRALIHALESKLAAPVRHPATKAALDWRRAIEWQILAYADHLKNPETPFEPWTAR